MWPVVVILGRTWHDLEWLLQSGLVSKNVVVVFVVAAVAAASLSIQWLRHLRHGYM